MSNVKKGLSAIKQLQAEQKARAEAASRPKANWFSSVFPKKTGDTLVVRFLQEMDEDSPNYNAERGLGFIAVEHQAPGPDGYKRRALCTADEDEGGECYACIRHKQNYKEGWRQRQNLYINVLAEVDGKLTTFILSRNANSSFVESLLVEAIDEGSITDANYRITKTGDGTSTNWLLKRLKGDTLDDSEAEVFDLNASAVREVEFDKQAEYYGSVYQGDSDAAAPAAKSSSAVDEEW